MQREQEAIINKKRKDPHLSHRKISGLLRKDGYWISASSCYRVLRSIGWVWPREFRAAPWKEPHYEPYRPNQIWGEDWTSLTIAGQRYYLLTIIDYFSRYIVAWGIVKTVTRSEVQELVALAYMSEGIEHKDPKPVFRMDRGFANIAHSTKRLIKDLEMIPSFSRVHRPTDKPARKMVSYNQTRGNVLLSSV
jgi:transposase InsO family protein